MKQKPDFIICGAMKSGTTTIHTILNNHEDIFIPHEEVHYWDADNIIEHPDFNFFVNNIWYNQFECKESKEGREWYDKQFEGPENVKLIGEDSTTYLASPLALKELYADNPAVKIIVMLRQPSSRAYSQYWHMLRTGRAAFNFEDTLLYYPESLLRRSLYLTQLESLYKTIPKSNIKVILFEEFIEDKVKVVSELCAFLDVDFTYYTKENLNVHSNPLKLPFSIHLEILKNRIFRGGGNLTYIDRLPIKYEFNRNSFYIKKCINLLYRLINPLIKKYQPKMRPETKKYLDGYFKKELLGINDLLEKDVFSYWFKGVK